MFDISQAYSGAMVSSIVDEQGFQGEDSVVTTPVMSPDQLLNQARIDAATIIENAHEEAEILKAKILSDAHLEAENQIAKVTNKAFVDLGLDLWSARNAIASIVAQSLHKIIGELDYNEACYRAVDTVACQYAQSHKLTVRAAPETANRLRLISVGNGQNKYSAKLEIIDDYAVGSDRCILDTGEKRVEVSVEAQINAVKRAATNATLDINSKGAQ